MNRLCRLTMGRGYHRLHPLWRHRHGQVHGRPARCRRPADRWADQHVHRGLHVPLRDVQLWLRRAHAGQLCRGCYPRLRHHPHVSAKRRGPVCLRRAWGDNIRRRPHRALQPGQQRRHTQLRLRRAWRAHD